MSVETVQSDSLLRQLIVDIAHLPEDDLPLVAEFFGKLRQMRWPEAGKPRRPSVVAIRAEARRRAALLANVPREELVTQFIRLTDEIRAEAIVQGTTLLEDEWQGD